MFWLFRRRKPLQPAYFYLDCAAGIIQVRGKCHGRTDDEFGRVDVLGAMRIAVWGVTSWEKVQFNRRAEYWQKYDEVKMLMHKYLHQYHPLFKSDQGCNRSWQTSHLHQWSDASSEHAVVAWMRQAASVAKHNQSVLL